MKQEQDSLGKNVVLSFGRERSCDASCGKGEATSLRRRFLLWAQNVSALLFWHVLLLALVVVLVLLLLLSRELLPRILSLQNVLHIHLLLQGMFVGFSIAAPVGPVSILCLQRTVSKGVWHGLASGMGNSLAIALYSAIAGFGVTAVSSFFLHQQGWFHLTGGIVLIFLGFKIMRTKPVEQATSLISESLGKDLLSTFLLALVNPVTIFLFAVALMSMNLEHTGIVWLSVTLVVLGVFLGSFFWQCVSSVGISLLGNTILRGIVWTVWINGLSGAVLFVLGCIALLNIFKSPISPFLLH